MKKHFKMQNLDCANCAAKMEAAIQRLEGVEKVSVNFLTQRLTLEAEDARQQQKLAELQAAAAKKHGGYTPSEPK